MLRARNRLSLRQPKTRRKTRPGGMPASRRRPSQTHPLRWRQQRPLLLPRTRSPSSRRSRDCGSAPEGRSLPTQSEVIGQELQRKQQELVQLFKAHETGQIDNEGGAVYEMSGEVTEEVMVRRAELDELEAKRTAAITSEALAKTLEEMDGLKTVQRRIPQPAPAGPDRVRDWTQNLQMQGKRLSDFVFESKEYKARTTNRGHFGVRLPDIDVKTLLTLSGYAPPNDRSPRVVLSLQRQPVISDVI